MPNGKDVSQAGHAYVDALLLSLKSDDGDTRAQANAYAALRPGTKVCLNGNTEAQLLMLEERLRAAGLPVVRIVDQGHICLPDFDGSPILTALGVGPITRAQTPSFFKKLKLYGKE